jgi:hypothetical protein
MFALKSNVNDILVAPFDDTNTAWNQSPAREQ